MLNQVDPNVLDEGRAVDIELEPGDISAHHPLVLHGSEPNTSERWRRGGSIQYMPSTTQVTKEDWPCLFLFRSEAADGINVYHPFPEYFKGEYMPFRGCESWP